MKRIPFFFAVALLPFLLSAQISSNISQPISINATGAAPDTSALLDLAATNKGVLVPRMTKSQRNAIPNPASGLMIFQTDSLAGFFFFNGSAWKPVGDSGGAGVPASGILLSETYPNANLEQAGFSMIGNLEVRPLTSESWTASLNIGSPNSQGFIPAISTGTEMIVWGNPLSQVCSHNNHIFIRIACRAEPLRWFKIASAGASLYPAGANL